MKKLLALFVTITLFLSAFSQRESADRVTTENGDLVIQPIVHGTVVLSWSGKTIYIDPYGGAERFEGLEDPDLILITDIHGDHLNQKTLDALNTESASFIVPQAVLDKLPQGMQSQARELANGESMDWGVINISAVPMYNLPETPESRHPKGRGNGYILQMGGKRVYLSGDTEDIPEMRSLKNIDVAFVCMNLPYTMDVDQAASAVVDFKPGIVYPYHYRGKGGLSDLASFKTQINDATPQVEVRLKDWYRQ